MRARLWICAFLLMLAAPALLRAQAVSGSLEGRILSTQGEPLERAVVTVSGPFLQGTRDVTTDARGRFLLLWLPAGTYTVRLRALGFGPVALRDVRVSLGATGSLGDVRLAPQAVELAEIVVSGARPLIDPTTAAAATVVDSAVFLALPTERNFRSLMALVPQSNSSPYGDGTNVAGATGLENSYFADGIHITDPLTANGSLNLPYNFVREVQVTTGGYEAEFGRAQGGLVNVITNSGGNEFHGQVLGFFTGNGLRAAPRWGLGQSEVGKFSQYDVGFSLGGPIRRDRLWFYAAYNPSVETSDAGFPGIPTQKDSRISHLFAGKLTGRVGPATDVTLTLLGDPSTRSFVGGVGNIDPLPANVSDPRAVSGRLRQGGMAATLQVRHQVGDRVLLTASLSRLDRRADDTPRSGPVTDLLALARLDDYVTNTASANYGRSLTAHTTRTAGQVGLTVLAGAHALKLGAEFEAGAMQQDGRGSIIVKEADTSYTWIQIINHASTNTYVPTVYLQDSWALTERLRLNLGLRWEAQFFSGDTATAFWIAPELAPRVGVVYQPGELGTQKVYASYGRFFEEIPMMGSVMWFGVNVFNTVAYRHNPLVDTTGAVSSGGSYVGEIPDRNIRGQQYDEWALGYERRLGGVYRVGLRGTYRTLLWAVDDGGPDFSGDFYVGNPGRGILSFLPRATREYTALELTLERSGDGPLTFLASYVLSRNRGNYTGLFSTDVLQAVPNSGPQFDTPESMVNATGPLPNDRTHVVKFSGSYRFPFGLTLGTAAIVATGEPLSEYGTAPEGTPYWTFIRPRGSAGRTPTAWNVDLRFAYDVPVARATGVRPRVVLDVFNVGNQRKALTYQQRHYLTSDESVVNPNYRAVTQYQAPLSARLGLVVNF